MRNLFYFADILKNLYLYQLSFHFINRQAIINPNDSMNNTYADLVQQTFNFPQEGFEVKENYLEFNGVDIKSLIDKYGTPLKTFLSAQDRDAD